MGGCALTKAVVFVIWKDESDGIRQTEAPVLNKPVGAFICKEERSDIGLTPQHRNGRLSQFSDTLKYKYPLLALRCGFSEGPR